MDLRSLLLRERRGSEGRSEREGRRGQKRRAREGKSASPIPNSWIRQ